MNRQHFRTVLSTLFLTLLIGAALVVSIARIGLLPIQADVAPSGLENIFFSMAVRASVARHTMQESAAAPLTDEEILSAGEIYGSMCAECHGQMNGKPSALGLSFYPPAPQFPGHSTGYTENQIFWIVKHGIRNTAMPAWRRLLSDDDIRRVAAFVKRGAGSESAANDTPPAPDR